ncbi:cytochrome c oxidase subunit II [Pseudanabaena sp. FACHB-2040]|uniref:cytochrome c oxidase subunit II n=1 Tax=Pseudanabaena sp. FACHB-2040 TaxID=2692859 RepID=UPI001684F1C3|nr:cytochrome c oxidase subunit II [Pseudanabaena sp. FACHB-2040]MBD2257965.1 cytochrome c oxidase subunit II [Pseudanabaena sp. FACHB-2040]
MKFRAIATLTIYAGLTIAISIWMAKESYSWFPPEATAEAKLIDDLFSLFTGLGTAILLGVLGPVVYSLIFHRVSKYDPSDGPHIEGNVTLEVIWTIVPVVLVLGLSFASFSAYEKMNLRGSLDLVHLHLPQMMDSAYAAPFDETPQEEIKDSLQQAAPKEIEVTARQWAWVFRYPDQDVTSTELHLPVNSRVRLALRSEDVIHGFYVPAFRIKQDIVPNHRMELEFTPTRVGQYRLRDSLFSGTYFAANQADVVVQSPEDYQQWLADAASQPLTAAYNPAATEYARATEQTAVLRGWASVVPAPPPVVNYSSQTVPKSPPA